MPADDRAVGVENEPDPPVTGTSGALPRPVVAAVDAGDAAFVAAAAGRAAAGWAAGRAAGRRAQGVADESLRDVLSGSARRFTRLSDEGQDDEAMLQAIVMGALRAIPTVAAASVSLVDRDGGITTRAPSDELIAEVDGLQADLGEGPCIDALRESGEDVTDVPDLSDPRAVPWPRLAWHAHEAGFGAVLSYQLVAQGSAGALNLWGAAPACFTDHDRLLGALFADQAAVALAGVRRAGALNQALAQRDVIGRAKGILTERFGVPDDAAFAILVESARGTDLQLVDVAGRLVGDTEARLAGGNG